MGVVAIMHSILIIVVVMASVLGIGSQILPSNLFKDHPSLCSELSSTMSEMFKDYNVDPSKLVQRSKREITEDFQFVSSQLLSRRNRSSAFNVFRFQIPKCDDPFNVTLKFDSGLNVSSIVPNGTLLNLLPMEYHVTEFRFINRSEFNEYNVGYTEGNYEGYTEGYFEENNEGYTEKNYEEYSGDTVRNQQMLRNNFNTFF